MHSVIGTAANVADVTQVDRLLHGEEKAVHADAGYTGGGEAARAQRKPSHLADCGAPQHLQAARKTQPVVAKDRERQGADARQGRASVSCEQAPVRLNQGALSWPGKKHCSVGHAIRSFKSVDGAPALADEHARGVPVMQGMSAERCPRG